MATTLLGSAGASQNRPVIWANQQDWLTQRSRIEELYIAKPLPEVMHIMENQHEFRATKKMYKSRFQQWGLAKYHREDEMRAAVRKQKQRTDRGRASIIRVRGKVIQYGDLVRYFERKHLTIEDVLAQRRLSATPELVECTTPVPTQIATPAALAMPEQTLLFLKDYYYGSFEAGTWVKSEPGKRCYSVKKYPGQGQPTTQPTTQFFEQIRAFCDLSDMDRSPEAGQALVIATARAKEIMLMEPPDIFETFFWAIHEICSRGMAGKYEITSAILKTFSDLSEVVLREHNPVRRIFARLSSIDIVHLQDLAIKALQSQISHLKTLVGPLHTSTLDAHRTYRNVVHRLGNTTGVEHATRGLLQTCDSLLGESDPRTVDLRLDLAWYLCNDERYLESSQICRDTLKAASSFRGEFRIQIQVHSLHQLAYSQHELGEIHLAEANLREAIRLRISLRGPQDGLVSRMLLGLEECLLNRGQPESAEEIRLWRQEIWESMMED